MRLVSIQVGRWREVAWRGKRVRTSIFKDPVTGPVRVHTLNLAGDEQSDLRVHGGVDKAVYAYPSEHYAYWRAAIPDLQFPWGAFGENLTTEGLSESTLQIGDRLAIGSAEFVVTEPRFPCFKLGIRFERQQMVQQFRQSGRSGFYLAVQREGDITAGDAIRVEPHPASNVTVADIVRLYTTDHQDPALLRRASELAALPASWRERFRKELADGAT